MNEKYILTIMILSYNRKDELKHALASVYAEKKLSAYGDQIQVVVVDDYSSDTVGRVIDSYRFTHDPIKFFLHENKCGVAEISLLNSLQFVDTRYVWVLGNDDIILPGSFDYIIPIIQTSQCSLYIFNLLESERGNTHEYFYGTNTEYLFENGINFFLNFGFVTTTTTFPCICFEVEPLRKVDTRKIYQISPIYSHTIAFFKAFYNKRCAFIASPLVQFNHNPAVKETANLEIRNRSIRKPKFYHATAGLMKLINYLSEDVQVELSLFANSLEDELKKDSFIFKKTNTFFFILHFLIKQLLFEIESTKTRKPCLFLSRSDINEVVSVLNKIPESNHLKRVKEMLCIYQTKQLEPQKKIELLSKLQSDLIKEEQELIDALYISKRACGYLIYPKMGGVKLLLMMDETRLSDENFVAQVLENQVMCVDNLLFSNPHKEISSDAFIASFKIETLSELRLKKLSSVINFTKADVLVFNSKIGYEDFYSLLHQYGNDLPVATKSTWINDELCLEDLQCMVKNTTILEDDLFIRSHCFRDPLKKLTVEFINCPITNI